MPNVALELNVQLGNIIILPELERFNPYRSEEELKVLKGQIQAEGQVRDPIVIWNNEQGHVLVDGFTRLRACRELYAETGGFGSMKACIMDFQDIEEVKVWITVNQMNRRNLTADQQAYHIGTLYNQLKTESAISSYLRVQGWSDGDLEKSKDKQSGRRSVLLAKHFNVNERTIRRSADYAASLEKIRKTSPALREALITQGKAAGIKFNQQLVVLLSQATARELAAFEQNDVDEAKKVMDRYRGKINPPSSPDASLSTSLKRAMTEFLTDPTEEAKNDVIKIMNRYISEARTQRELRVA